MPYCWSSEKLRCEDSEVERVRELGQEGKGRAEKTTGLRRILGGLVLREDLVEETVGWHGGLIGRIASTVDGKLSSFPHL